MSPQKADTGRSTAGRSTTLPKARTDKRVARAKVSQGKPASASVDTTAPPTGKATDNTRSSITLVNKAKRTAVIHGKSAKDKVNKVGQDSRGGKNRSGRQLPKDSVDKKKKNNKGKLCH